VTPSRILDTRSGTCIQCGSGALGPGATRTLQITGVGGLPSGTDPVPSSATAVVLNVTAVGGAGSRSSPRRQLHHSLRPRRWRGGGGPEPDRRDRYPEHPPQRLPDQLQRQLQLSGPPTSAGRPPPTSTPRPALWSQTLVVVELATTGSAGGVDIYNHVGLINFIFDVEGWFQ
jgi:hypothetical protein